MWRWTRKPVRPRYSGTQPLQDPGTAVHPTYVEGQIQGGAVQGIGWALNEVYVTDAQGRMLNATLLDYRMPIAKDLPMIDTQIVEVPNPDHPTGVRGVGEVSIIPPIPAIANAINQALGIRMTETPMSPNSGVGGHLGERTSVDGGGPTE